MKVVLVAKVANRVHSLQSVLAQSDCEIIATLRDAGDLMPLVRDRCPDIVIIDVDTPDRAMLDHIAATVREESKPVVMFAQDESTATIRDAVEAGVGAYVFDGISSGRVRPIIDTAVAHFEQTQALRRALEAVENQLAERKFIERAKGLLMKRRNLSEDAAYRAMRKQAMDNRTQLAQIARQVIAIDDL